MRGNAGTKSGIKLQMSDAFTSSLRNKSSAWCWLAAAALLTWGVFDRSVDANDNNTSAPVALALGQNVDEEAAEGPADDASPKKKKPDIISVRPFLSVDKFPPGGECEVLMYVTVKEGWHINANPAMPDNFIATTVTLKSKQKCELTNIKYPKSHPITLAGIDEPVHTYDGQVAIRGVILIPVTAAGQVDEMEIHVRYQACNDKSCLPPATLVFKTKVPVAGIGQEVKAVNQNLFRAEDEKEKK